METTASLDERSPDDAMGSPRPGTHYGPEDASVLGRLRVAVRYAAPAIAAYAAVRAVGLLMLYVWTSATGRDFGSALGKSDAVHLLRIAQDGYDMGNSELSNLAFFPLYPGIVAALDAITPFAVRPTGILVAWVASLVAAWGIFAVGAHLHGRRVGIMLAVLWGVLPHAIVESMPYTEGLFTALAAWSLYAVLTRRWVTAGLLCLLAGLTRSAAVALIAAVAVAALVAIVRRQDGWRPWAALVLAPLGWIGYIAWVARVTGRVDGWFHIQGEQWKMGWDGGASTVEYAADLLAKESAFELMLVSITMLAALALFVLSVIDRQPLALLAYSALTLATTLGAASYYNARARFLLPAFALLLPMATGLAKTAPARRWVVVGALALASAYVGCYLLLIWRDSP